MVFHAEREPNRSDVRVRGESDLDPIDEHEVRSIGHYRMNAGDAPLQFDHDRPRGRNSRLGSRLRGGLRTCRRAQWQTTAPPIGAPNGLSRDRRNQKCRGEQTNCHAYGGPRSDHQLSLLCCIRGWS